MCIDQVPFLLCRHWFYVQAGRCSCHIVRPVPADATTEFCPDCRLKLIITQQSPLFDQALSAANPSNTQQAEESSDEGQPEQKSRHGVCRRSCETEQNRKVDTETGKRNTAPKNVEQ